MEAGELMETVTMGKSLSMKLTEQTLNKPGVHARPCTLCQAGAGIACAMFIVRPGGETTSLGAVCAQCADQFEMLAQQIKASGA